VKWFELLIEIASVAVHLSVILVLITSWAQRN